MEKNDSVGCCMQCILGIFFYESSNTGSVMEKLLPVLKMIWKFFVMNKSANPKYVAWRVL
jgi:hypothetical protein